MLRGYEIVDFHIVARISEHFRGIGIKFALAVGYDHGLAAPQRLKQRIQKQVAIWLMVVEALEIWLRAF